MSNDELLSSGESIIGAVRIRASSTDMKECGLCSEWNLMLRSSRYTTTDLQEAQATTGVAGVHDDDDERGVEKLREG